MLSKCLLALILSVPQGCLLLAGEQHFYNFGGINSQDDPLFIADTDAVAANNVLTDDGDLRTIYGNTLNSIVSTNSVNFLGEWVNTTGQNIIFAQSGSNLYATSPSSGVFSAIKTFTGVPDLDMVPAFGSVYFVDGSAAPFYTTGSSATVAPGMESCKFIELYETRLACVNTTTETSKVYLSAYNAPSTWTVTASKDSAAIKYFHKDDGEQINCVFTTPAGLFIGKDTKVGMLKGDNNEKFYWREIDPGVGCVDDRTVQMVDGRLVWLSRNGFYAWDFTNAPDPISREITPLTRLIRRSNSSESNWTVNTKAAWDEGNTTGWDSGISLGQLKTLTYNSGVSTTSAAALVHVSTNAGFNDGTRGGWTIPAGFSWETGIAPSTEEQLIHLGQRVGAYWLRIERGSLATKTMTVKIRRRSDGVVLSSSVIVAPDNACAHYTFTSLPTTTLVYMTIQPAGINGSLISTEASSGNFIPEYGMVSMKHCNKGGSGGSFHPSYFDIYDSSYAYTSPWSPAFDSVLSTVPAFNKSSLATAASVNLSYSADNVTFSTSVAPNRYVKYQVQFSSGLSISSFTSVELSVLSTATYLSSVRFTDTNVSQWKMFNVSDIETGAVPSFYTRSSSNNFTVNSATPSWVFQVKNATVTAPAGAYIQFKIDPNITTSTQSVSMISVNIGYTIGSAAPLAASVVDDHRYIASVSHNSSTENDITYIWQKNKKWVTSDKAYNSMSLYNNIPLAGDTSAASRIWRIMDTSATSFDGTAISSYWTTKAYTFGQLNNHKVINRVWIAADNSGLTALNLAWQANRNGVWNSANTTLVAPSFINKEFEGLFETQYPGRQFNFRFSASELSRYFRIKFFSIYFTINPLIKD